MLTLTGSVASTTALQSLAQKPGISGTTRRYKIVVTGGHPGDPEYGCGGTIARLSAAGHKLVLLYLNDGAWQQTSATTRMAEARKACAILDAEPTYANQVNGNAMVDNAHYRAFQTVLENENPNAVFTHWPIDNHPDHRAIANLSFESWKQLKHSFALYYYEVSDGEDTTQFPVPTHYMDISGGGSKESGLLCARESEPGVLL
jgi:N-acetylglucosamine malate deacetylase 1